MRLAVSGAAGFIGSRLVRQALAAGHRVLGLDNLSLGQPPLAPEVGLEFVVMDIRDGARLQEVLGAFAPDAVAHLAAVHHIPTCEARPAYALDVNVVGTQLMLDAIQAIGCARLVFTSTGAVYDWLDGPLGEDATPTSAQDVYSVSKLTNESQIRLWQGRTGGAALVARLFNTIGPGDRNAHLIPDLLVQLRAPGGGGPVVVRLGNTSTRRDYVFVDDVAAALLRMAEATELGGRQLINVGTGVEYGVLDIVEHLGALVGMRVQVEIDPTRVRRVDRLHQCADVRRAAALLGWKAACDLNESLRRIVAAA